MSPKTYTPTLRQPALYNDIAQNCLAFILAGGRGNRLMNLTDHQAKPAVDFGGTFRIIDFTLSNCLNSGFRRVMVATQYCAESLEEYLPQWNPYFTGAQSYLHMLPANPDQPYEGTADAAFKNLKIIAREDTEWVLVLAGDHVYKMDYSAMLAQHIATGADITIPCVEVPRKEATGFGIMKVDTQGRITDFLEKPADPPGMPDKPQMALASMGIYIFNRQFLMARLAEDSLDPHSSHDFGKDIIPRAVKDSFVMAHRFTDSSVNGAYWRDVGTVDAYWAANMDLTVGKPVFDVYDGDWPISTPPEALPPAKFFYDTTPDACVALDSLISPGCIINSAFIEHSLLSTRVQVSKDSSISESVLLPGARIGRNVRLSRVIVDRDCVVPDGLVIGANPEEDSRRFHRTPAGIVLVNNSMIQDLQR